MNCGRTAQLHVRVPVLSCPVLSSRTILPSHTLTTPVHASPHPLITRLRLRLRFTGHVTWLPTISKGLSVSAQPRGSLPCPALPCPARPCPARPCLTLPDPAQTSQTYFENAAHPCFCKQPDLFRRLERARRHDQTAAAFHSPSRPEWRRSRPPRQASTPAI